MLNDTLEKNVKELYYIQEKLEHYLQVNLFGRDSKIYP